MNLYEGFTKNHVVLVNGEKLNPRLDVFSHSPTGFSWGYGGSGPAQLALAIMVYEFGDDLGGHPLPYQAFKDEVIARFANGEDFSITSDDILEWLSSQPHIMGGAG